jgi:hypothetical protein
MVWLLHQQHLPLLCHTELVLASFPAVPAVLAVPDVHAVVCPPLCSKVPLACMATLKTHVFFPKKLTFNFFRISGSKKFAFFS